MGHRTSILFLKGLIFSFFLLIVSIPPVEAQGDLDQIIKRGELRHLGIPYANFVKGDGEGLDVELIKGFAKHLGVKYKFVSTNWINVFPDLLGKELKAEGTDFIQVGERPVKGDIIATGLTKLDWRAEIVDFSTPTFPTQVWCIARADFPVNPIKSSGDINEDIAKVKEILKGRKIMGKEGTCLTPWLYGIDETIADIVNFPGNLNDIAPAIMKGDAEIALLDVPDALVALEKWPGKIKVLGPLSKKQVMAAAVRKDSPELLGEFNLYLDRVRENGEYSQLVKKYYPAVYRYFGSFFSAPKQAANKQD